MARRPTSRLGTVDSQSDGDWAAMTAREDEQAYDSNRRPTVQRLKSGSTTYALTQTSYDEFGRVQCVAQRMNPSRIWTRPATPAPRHEGSHGPDRIARTSYDAGGRVTWSRPAIG